MPAEMSTKGTITPSLIKRRCGPCKRCGQKTELFVGKWYCDACIRVREKETGEDARRRLLAHLIGVDAVRRGTPETRFATADPAPAENEEAWTWAKGWDMKQNVYLFGPYGTGKTYLARCLLNRAFDMGGRRIAEVSARRLVKVAARFDEGKGAFSLWAEADVLLLDDLDKARWTEDSLSTLWELLDTRANGCQRTVMTTNMAPVNLASYMRERVPQNSALVSATLDRVKPVMVLELKGKSLRATEHRREG